MLRAAGWPAVEMNASQRQHEADSERNIREHHYPEPAAAATLCLPARQPSHDGGQPHQPRWRRWQQLLPARPRFILRKAREDREHRRQSGLTRAQCFSNPLQGSLLRRWQAQSPTPSARCCATRSYPGPEAQTCDRSARPATAVEFHARTNDYLPSFVGVLPGFLRQLCRLPWRSARKHSSLSAGRRPHRRARLTPTRPLLIVVSALHSWSLRRLGLVCV